MPKQKKNSLEKPDWFNLENYIWVEKLNYVQWFYEILIRKRILDNIKAGTTSNKDLVDLELIRSMGFISPRYTNAESHETTGYEKWVNENMRTNAVRLTTCGDVSLHDLGDVMTENCNQPKNPGDLYDRHIPYDVHSYSQTSITPDEINITINLSSPNSTLKEDFRKVLDAAREHFKIETQSSSVSFKKIKQWTNNQVLPYLDIHTCAVENNLNIDHATLSEWIPPKKLRKSGLGESNNSQTKKSKRTMHSNALSLMDDKFISEFESELFSGEFRDKAELLRKQILNTR